MDVDFSIDKISSGEVHGWAWLPGQPELLLTIELVSEDGDVVHHAMASEFRYDLAVNGKRGGWCAFHLAIDSALPTGSYDLRARSGEIVVGLNASVRHARSVAAFPSFDPNLSDRNGAYGWLDEAGPARFAGWLAGGDAGARRLELVADGEVVATGPTGLWREDLAEMLQGDGRRAFSIPLPATLCDGAEHVFDLRWEGGDSSLLSRPVTATTALETLYEEPEPVPVRRPAADAPIELSVIVNFYNMPREAERTLISLSRPYQRDAEDIAYEVLCIDNGSNPAMTEEDVSRHGPEFRLIRPDRPHPSPVFALNEATRAARGRYVAVMIDGAHLLSPGVIAEAVAALREEKRAMIAVRHWFIGGDQRWLHAIGFRREQQDLPLARIGWPASGYDIFKISAPIQDSPNTWFDNMSESNCLFVSKADFVELGGYDEAFDVAGGGFANLDLFVRAANLPGMTVVALIGEATFHQYHEGTTTNVSDAEKDRRVRRYAVGFETLRQKSFVLAESRNWKYRGVMRTDHAMSGRQSPGGKVRLGLTADVRRTRLPHVVDDGTRDYLCSAYVESGGPHTTLWLGQPTGVAPADLIAIQRLLWDRRPDALLMTDVEPGLLHFIRTVAPVVGLSDLRLVWLTASDDGATPAGVRRIVGTLADGVARAKVDEAIGPAENVMVLFQPTGDFPLDQLRAHAGYVTVESYLIVLGAGYGQPTLGYSTRWTTAAIRRFVQIDRRFAVDRTMSAQIVTTCPEGFLVRIPESYDVAYDSALDIFEEV